MFKFKNQYEGDIYILLALFLSRVSNIYSLLVLSKKFAPSNFTDDGIKLPDPAKWLCNAKTCKYANSYFRLYRDDNHWNECNAMYLQPQLNEAFEEFVK